MNHRGFTQQERNLLMQQYEESFKQTSWPVFQTLSSPQRRKEYARQDRLLDEYGENIPFVAVSRCPFTGKTLEYPMDPFGFDGIWWKPKELADYPAPQCSEHFRVLLGAVDFHGREPVETEAQQTVLPGPGVPFVVPELLQLEGMKAVISRLTLARGDTAYLIAYFSEKPIHGALLHQPWGRDSYQVFDADGEYEGWTASNARWDFDLQPWLDSGVLGWINPGDESLKPVFSGNCPYVALEGVRQPQILSRGKLLLGDLPSGEPLQPFE